MPAKTKSSAKEYSFRKKTLLKAASDHKIRIINTTIGEFRTFSGTITIPSKKDAEATDAARIKDIKDKETALVYWADGSQFRRGVNEVLGAGVVWRDEEKWQAANFTLDLNTGDAIDAELFGVAAALQLAIGRVDEGECVDLVRIFSDSQNVLSGVLEGTIVHLGPVIGKNWALQNLYNRGMVWVKGHSVSEGNKLANTAATNAGRMQVEILGGETKKRRMLKKEDAPVEMKDAGEDAVQEWYWRVNGELLLSGVEQLGEDEDAASEGSAAMDISEDDEDSS
ncbi:hypothetical protein EK21DRAFT_97814 [Setomelanomma holmii]|uniref:RNase H type-1 domain-containing protein n=1 Tax=Setomelanomma holmii TaxID=210430 RepID=A0A9P4HGA0_9PLEO|nr:hypothetical protein EK21DRAFT_97814 [Setomelanomma holmii]